MQGTLIICDGRGHTEVLWDSETENDNAANGPLNPRFVEREFKRLVGQGHLAYVDRGEGNEMIRSFDPTVETITLTPALVGG